MWDNWYDDLYCIRKKVGVLRGYKRIFNKASTRNWGTKENPGPTLNLAVGKHSCCKGIVFEFPDENRFAVLKKLKDREGKGFEFPELPVRLCLSTTVQAVVSFYKGNNTLPQKSLEELAQMALNAKGKGSCCDYILNLDEEMKQLGIRDPVVRELAECLRSIKLRNKTNGGDIQ